MLCTKSEVRKQGLATKLVSQVIVVTRNFQTFKNATFTKLQNISFQALKMAEE